MKKIKIIVLLMTLCFFTVYITGNIYANVDNTSNIIITNLKTGKNETLNMNISMKKLLNSKFDKIEGYKPANLRQIKEKEIDMKKIINDDDRYEAENTKYPYSAIAYLEARDTYGNLKSIGTAFMISDNVAITAAHCVKGYQAINIYPGYSKGYAPFGGAQANMILTDQRYTDFKDKDIKEPFYDWAILILDKNIGNNSGWLGLTSDIGNNCGFSSYPVDKFKNGYAVQIYSPGKFAGLDTYGEKVYFTNDTIGGSSGGPVMHRYGNDQYYAHGICSFEHSAPQYTYNFAQWITQDLLKTAIYIVNNY